jgi:hypothetical protein
MIITATIINCTAGTSVRHQKSLEIIKQQMERIYTLYGQGYGTREMLHSCEQKVYVIFTKIPY